MNGRITFAVVFFFLVAAPGVADAKCVIRTWRDGFGIVGADDGVCGPTAPRSRRDAKPGREATSSVQSLSLAELVERAARTIGVDRRLIQSVVIVESNGNPSAVSRKGAAGLMQLMPATARQHGVVDAFDPWQNLLGGTRYLKSLLERFRGKVDLALAAYNAGEGRVREYGGVPPFSETRRYVTKVLALHRSQTEPREVKLPAKIVFLVPPDAGGWPPIYQWVDESGRVVMSNLPREAWKKRH